MGIQSLCYEGDDVIMLNMCIHGLILLSATVPAETRQVNISQ